jgi:imidazolonepropionase-like amidohydrolase
LIHAGHLIHPASEKTRDEQTLIIEDGRIKSIHSGFRKPQESDKFIDLSQSWVLPGLMDMHTHLSFEYSRKAQIQRFTRNEADYAIAASVYARRTLQAGFTTVRDLGDAFRVTIALREAINRGLTAGPRIFTAGKSIATTGGHADPSNGMRRDLMGSVGPEEGVINGTDEARQAVRKRYQDGSDLIKITATGGVLSVAKNGHNPQFTEAELDAIVKTARDYGFKVAAHAHGTEGIKRAIIAGVDSIEHGTYLDNETIALMKRRGTYLVPTITAGQWVADKAKLDGFFPALVRPKAARIGPQIVTMVKKAYKSGVKIAFGTDTGVSKHGRNAQEFAYLVEAGMTPMEAIQAATVHAAHLLGVDNRLGQLKAGYAADIVATEQNPLNSIRALEAISFVMKDGQVYRQENGESQTMSH